MINMERCEYCNLWVPRAAMCRREADLEECPNAPPEPDDND